MNFKDIFYKFINGDGDRSWTQGAGDNFFGGAAWSGRGDAPMPLLPKILLIALGLLVIFFVGLGGFVAFYTDLLWFESQGFGSVLWYRFFYQAALFAACALATFVVCSFNWIRAARIGMLEYRAATGGLDSVWMRPCLAWLAACIFALLDGFGSMSNWPVAMRFLYGNPFGESDAIFGMDIGFYVFSLPFLNILLKWLTGLFILTLCGCFVVYMLTRSLRSEQGKITLIRDARLHLAALASICIFLFGCGLWLSRYELLYSPSGIVYGMGYTDRFIRLPLLTAVSLTMIASSAVILANFYRPMWRVSIGVVGGIFLVGLLAQVLLPQVVQNYIVKPNEYEYEKKFLEYHIKSTRRAFSIDDVKIFQMTPEPEVSYAEMQSESDTVENIRLWDYSPLLRTYKQLQEIRTYYDFADIDIDRYDIDGRSQQVMLSARELDTSQLQSRTWVNMHLEFTHGYGVVMNPVNEMEEGGLPSFFIKDLPPKSSFPISIERPQIYYGEKPESYALVKTDVNEFDYPMGDSNIRSSYEGTGGVEIGTLARRLLYALRFRDSEIFFTGSLRPDSRILYNRNIKEAIRTAAPYLILEDDAYPIITNGRILWLQDAYTASSHYPYSRPLYGPGVTRAGLDSYIGVNYIRNSVKITVDAYDGAMKFYITDDSDPIIRAWAGIFPAQFEPLENAPLDIRSHFRYPEEFFEVQSEVYRVYHMTDTNTYYNREDVWMTTPQGQERRIRPNYVTMQLLDEDSPEFVMIAPFMPFGRSNLIGWMAGRSDGQRYGELVVYQFPKQELIFGPAQIEALIDQNTEISSQLSLWSQRGSDVIRGDLLVIPIARSLLYVQPLYLKAERGELPELKRVILSTGGRVAWGETFDEAVASLFGASTSEIPSAPGKISAVESSSETGDTLRDLIKSARMHFDAALRASRAGEWASYGIELDNLAEVLGKLEYLTGDPARDSATTDVDYTYQEGEVYNDDSKR
ncbi:MAG: UPF0182 family protein [Synergistaceae bacterium]|jgi:uncharacterized membrane protein (UPF0182 family)|nr:UPF0182 family protein [Synergistaceae bacterium]